MSGFNDKGIVETLIEESLSPRIILKSGEFDVSLDFGFIRELNFFQRGYRPWSFDLWIQISPTKLLEIDLLLPPVDRSIDIIMPIVNQNPKIMIYLQAG